jgi:hypothetical protein
MPYALVQDPLFVECIVYPELNVTVWGLNPETLTQQSDALLKNEDYFLRHTCFHHFSKIYVFHLLSVKIFMLYRSFYM